MKPDRLGEEERPDKQKDERIGERAKDLLRRRHAKDHARRRAEQRRHRQRQGLREPEHHHDGDDDREPLRFRGEVHEQECIPVPLRRTLSSEGLPAALRPVGFHDAVPRISPTP